MSGPLLARHLAHVLARDLADAVTPPTNRQTTIRAMRGALGDRKTRRTRTRWFGGLAAAVALSIVGAVLCDIPVPTSRSTVAAGPPEVVATHVAGGVLVLAGERTVPLLDARAIGPGDRVVALQEGEVTIALGTSTRLSVGGGGDFAILSDGPTQIFALQAGNVRADVAKLQAGERFVLRTPDAEVEASGASFRVAIAPPDLSCGNGTTTRVRAFEGTVTVRSHAVQASVYPGEVWPYHCVPAHP
jgi:ferric-dicitrate binding protein FerR (iron transport regulator)